MIRVVLTVALATALFAASLPAVDSARADRTAAALDADLAQVRAATTGLVDHDDPTHPGVAGARRVVGISLPPSSWTRAAVDSVTVAGGGGGADTDRRVSTVGYTLKNGRQRRVEVDAPLRTPEGPLVFDESGTHRLVATLRGGDGGAVVVVRRG